MRVHEAVRVHRALPCARKCVCVLYTYWKDTFCQTRGLAQALGRSGSKARGGKEKLAGADASRDIGTEAACAFRGQAGVTARQADDRLQQGKAA